LPRHPSPSDDRSDTQNRTRGTLPSREAILAFLADHPGSAGKREIARAFGIAGSAKIALKHVLRTLEAEGLVEKRHRRLAPTGRLTRVFVAEVTGRDGDGDLIARPEEWDEAAHGPEPVILVLDEKKSRTGGPRPPAAGVGDRLLLSLHDADVELPQGVSHAARVVRVLDRRPPATLGVVRLVGDDARLMPIDKRSREMTVAPADLGEAGDGDLVAVEILRSGGRLGLPRARVREVIGSLDSEKAVSEIALFVHAIPHVFPAAVVAEAEACRPVGLGRREDWRDLPLVTIDPPDAKDHDDAVHAAPDGDPDNPGGFVVTVAIADVAHYVRPGSALDREALKRGNSVYFPDRVVPMLPERISTDLCSLREKEDRPALAVKMRFAAGGKKIDHSFHRILMRSAGKLAYTQAQAAIDGHPDAKTETLVDGVLKPLWAAYTVLKRGRDARAPLDLDLPERKVLLKPDGTVDRVVVPERLDAHRLIEEFMIQANVAAAETLEKAGVPLLYRIHDAPSDEKIAGLKEFLSTLDIRLGQRGGIRPATFNAILARVADTAQADLVNEVVLRSQAQAEYNPTNIGHFGLNLRRYAHFTSPIRRYADLIVHRALIRAHRFGDDGLPEAIDGRLDGIGAEISAAERRAMAAERETIDRLIARWLADRVGASFPAKISGVTKSGLFVRLDESGADGFVPASTIGDDYWVYDAASHAMVGSRTGETYRLGDAAEVRLVEAAPFAGALRFELLSAGSRGRPLGRKRMAAAETHRVRGAPSRGRHGPPRR
jgi:ribonuclease R